MKKYIAGILIGCFVGAGFGETIQRVSVPARTGLKSYFRTVTLTTGQKFTLDLPGTANDLTGTVPAGKTWYLKFRMTGSEK